MTDKAIPATLTFTEPTRGMYGDRALNLKLNTEYKVVEVKHNTSHNDYGYILRTSLVVQREGGKRLTIPWNSEAVQC